MLVFISINLLLLVSYYYIHATSNAHTAERRLCDSRLTESPQPRNDIAKQIILLDFFKCNMCKVLIFHFSPVIKFLVFIIVIVQYHM
jgi:hypothetical protein